jgi:hypothetical protein
LRDALYVFGGTNGISCNNDIVVCTFHQNMYTTNIIQDLDFAPCGRYEHSFTLVNKKCYVYGGRDQDGRLFGDLWYLDCPEDQFSLHWKLLTQSGPGLRYRHRAYEQDGKLIILGGLNENGAVLNDIWQFDGAEWRETGAFDPTPLLFGLGDAFFSVEGDRILQVTTRPTVALLWANMDVIKAKQQAVLEHLAEYQKAIHERRLELMHPSGNLGTEKVMTTGMCSPASIAAVREKIDDLRKKFFATAGELFEVHANEFCKPPPAPPNVLFEYSSRLQSELALLPAKYASRKAELVAEGELYRSLLSSDEVTGSRAARTTYDSIVEYIEKIRRLQDHLELIARHERKIAQIKAKTVRADRRLTTLLSAIATLEARVEIGEQEAEKAKGRLAELTALVERSQTLLSLAGADPAGEEAIIARCRKNLDAAVAQFSETLEKTLTREQWAAIVTLEQMVKTDSPGMLGAIKNTIDALLAKVAPGADPPILAP